MLLPEAMLANNFINVNSGFHMTSIMARWESVRWNSFLIQINYPTGYYIMGDV